MARFRLLVLLTLIGFVNTVFGQPSGPPLIGKVTSYPIIGAQIWVEPGMDAATIDLQFATLAKHDMPVTRLFMVWNWMEVNKGQWDFTLYDQCFTSAQKHGVRIVATLMPNQPPTYAGGYYKVQDGAVAHTQAELDAQALYISKVVSHFGKHPALDTWMLMNEPGQLPSPDPLAMTKFRPWLQQRYNNDLKALNTSWLSGYTSFDSVQYSPNWAGGGWTWPGSYVDWNVFWRDHLTWYMRWIATEIRKYDPVNGLHINPHALLDIQEKYDLPTWSEFLTSLGCSIHPVWHFDALARNQYGNGVSFVSDYIRKAAGDKPFWITELQGGINLYTGTNAITPTAAEIERWLWTGIGAGAKSTIFWCLNPRLKGTEAGEWAMLDYQYQPTDRLLAASKVAKALKSNPALWSAAEPIVPQIYLVQSQETMVLQGRAKLNQGDNLIRTQRAHKNAVLGTYLALQRLGIGPQVLNVPQMDWQTKDKRTKLAILPHATSLTDDQLDQMQSFVMNGNVLVVTGLIAMFDDYEGLRYARPSPLQKLLGADVVSVQDVSNGKANAEIVSNKQVRIRLRKAADQALSKLYGDSVWVTQHGKGYVVVVGVAAGLDQYYDPTKTQWTALLDQLANTTKTKPDYSFGAASKDVYMRQMHSGTSELTILTNTNINKANQVSVLGGFKKPKLIYGQATITIAKGGYSVKLNPDATVVIKWD